MDAMRWSEPGSPHDGGGPPTIKNHSVTYFNSHLYCFGGYDGRRNHMTLLLYSIRYQTWISPLMLQAGDESSFQSATATDVIVTGTPPPGRNGHTATLAADRGYGENGRIIIIGGWLGTGPLAASDMYVLDVSNTGGRHSLQWYQPVVKGTPPGPCNMHSADYVPTRREVYVFRGGNGREYLNDLHALNVDTYTWRNVETAGALPQQRANHSSAVLEETAELFIFGGWNGKERLNDIHILDTKSSTWTCPHVGGVLPHPRAGMTLTALRGRLYLFGGSGTSSKCFQDLQILDRKEMAWLDVLQHEDTPSKVFYEQNVGSDNEEYHARAGLLAQCDKRSGTVGVAVPTQPDVAMDSAQEEPASSLGVGVVSPPSEWEALAMDHHGMIVSSGRVAGVAASPNPNDEEAVSIVLVNGKGPGRRAGHTATAVNRKIYVFGGSCGSDYLNDFFVLDTDPPPQAIVTEPTSLQLLERTLRNFYNNNEFSDVTFVVEGQRVYGHKMVLSIASDCFRAMFTTGFRESRAGAEIEIPNCSYGAFLAMMEYIYTGQGPKVDLALEGGEGIGRVVDLLELADQFFLDHLKQLCEKILQPTVNDDTAEYLLQVSQKTNAPQLLSVCEHYQRNRGGFG